MDYFAEFHWWYLLAGIILIPMIFGKSRGGIVLERYIADMEILDECFKGCRPEASYSIFKEGKPHHIDIEIENLALPTGEELDFRLNGETLAKVEVEKDKEAEFDYWSDEGVKFPVIKEGDELVIRYENTDVLKGVFKSRN